MLKQIFSSLVLFCACWYQPRHQFCNPSPVSKPDQSNHSWSQISATRWPIQVPSTPANQTRTFLLGPTCLWAQTSPARQRPAYIYVYEGTAPNRWQDFLCLECPPIAGALLSMRALSCYILSWSIRSPPVTLSRNKHAIETGLCPSLYSVAMGSCYVAFRDPVNARAVEGKGRSDAGQRKRIPFVYYTSAVRVRAILSPGKDRRLWQIPVWWDCILLLLEVKN